MGSSTWRNASTAPPLENLARVVTNLNSLATQAVRGVALEERAQFFDRVLGQTENFSALIQKLELMIATTSDPTDVLGVAPTFPPTTDQGAAVSTNTPASVPVASPSDPAGLGGPSVAPPPAQVPAQPDGPRAADGPAHSDQSTATAGVSAQRLSSVAVAQIPQLLGSAKRSLHALGAFFLQDANTDPTNRVIERQWPLHRALAKIEHVLRLPGVASGEVGGGAKPRRSRRKRQTAAVGEPEPPKRVLIADDEEYIIGVLKRILKDHHVVAVKNGREALEAIANQPDFDLILCDLMMPGLTGPDVYNHLLVQKPEIEDKLFFMSGGAFTPTTREFARKVADRLVEKPFTPQHIRNLLKRIPANDK